MKEGHSRLTSKTSLSDARSKLHISKSDSIINEIHSLILKRKKVEREFLTLRKKLYKRRGHTVISSDNWEDWKLLSMEYDEIKKIISDIDDRYMALKRLRDKLK